MPGTTALVLFRSVLFRDVFTNLLARQGSSVRGLPLAEALAEKGAGLAAASTLVLEAREGEESLVQDVCRRLLEWRTKDVTVYVVHLDQDRITEYRRREHASLARINRDIP